MRKLIKIFLLILISFTVIACMPQRSTTPTISPMLLLVWANEAAVTAYTYNFATYQHNLQQASHYFTLSGWQYYEATLDLNRVVAQKLTVSAVATGAPLILQQGPRYGKYSWTVQMPLLVTYQNARMKQSQHLVLTIRIVTYSQGVRGLAIDQLSAIPAQMSTY